jgi:DNA-binding transcriptional LysR family regulator
MQSISKAAKELYMSQPALTKYINKLEEEIGVKLFNRSIIPITLTYAGERFVEEAKKILNIDNHLGKELEEISNMKKGRLTVGITSSRGEYWLPNILPIYKKRYPGIELKILEGSYMYLEDKLEKNLIDILLMGMPVYSDLIDYEALEEEEILLIVPTMHPLVQGMDLSQNSLDNPIYNDPEKLNGQDFILLSHERGIPRIVETIFEKYMIKTNNVMETQDIDVAYKLAVRGLGLTFASELCVTSFFPKYLPALCRIEEQPYKRKSIAAFRKGDYLSHPMRAFIDTVKEVLESCPEYHRFTHDEFVQARKADTEESAYNQWIQGM